VTCSKIRLKDHLKQLVQTLEINRFVSHTIKNGISSDGQIIRRINPFNSCVNNLLFLEHRLTKNIFIWNACTLKLLPKSSSAWLRKDFETVYCAFGTTFFLPVGKPCQILPAKTFLKPERSLLCQAQRRMRWSNYFIQHSRYVQQWALTFLKWCTFSTQRTYEFHTILTIKRFNFPTLND